MMAKGTMMLVFTAVFAAAFCFIAMPDTSDAAPVVGPDDCQYELNGTEATFLKSPEGAVSVDVPDTVTIDNVEYTVTAIGPEAVPPSAYILTIGMNVKTIDSSALDRTNKLERITADSDYFSDLSGILYNADYSKLVFYPQSKGQSTPYIMNGVKEIGEKAFSFADAVTTLEIPESVTHIGAYAFQFCTQLTTVTLPAGLTELGDYAFMGCFDLVEIPELPESLNTIGENVFKDCTKLQIVDIPGSITAIKASAFSGCEGISCVSIAEGVSVDPAAFPGFTFYATDGTELTGNSLVGILFYGSGTETKLYDSRTGFTITFDNGSDWVSSKKMTTTADGKLPSFPEYEGFLSKSHTWYDSNGVMVDENTVFTEDCTLHSSLTKPDDPSDTNPDNLLMGAVVIVGLVALILVTIIYSPKRM